MVKANALSVETVDSKVLNLAKQDIIWHSVNELLTEDETDPILGLNIVEFAGNNKEKIDRQVTALCRSLDEKIEHNQDHIIGYQVCSDLPSIERIYAMRKKPWAYLVMQKVLPNRFLSWKILVSPRKSCGLHQ